MIEAMGSYEMAVKYNPLEINYRNVLNNVYLKMAVTSLNKDSNNTNKEALSDFSAPARPHSGGQEQTAM